jgi:cardiolipin synthase
MLVPVFVYQYLAKFENHFYFAGLTLILSGLTDVIDGFIARTFNMISTVGKLLDPIADKLTQGIVVVCLAMNHTILIPLIVLFYAKELTMLLGAVRLLKMELRPSEAKWWGKLATVVMYILLMLTLISDIFPVVPDWGIVVVAVLAAICILFALFNYYQIFQDIQNGKYDIEKEAAVKL